LSEESASENNDAFSTTRLPCLTGRQAAGGRKNGYNLSTAGWGLTNL